MFKYTHKLVWQNRINIMPQAKQSTQFSKNGFAFTPAKKREYQNALKSAIANSQGLPPKPLDKPLALIITYFFPAPKKHTSTKKKAAEFEARGNWAFKTSSPDMDNLMKAVADAMNKVVFVDDSRVCDTRLRKFETSGTPGIEIKLYELEYKTDEQELGL